MTQIINNLTIAVVGNPNCGKTCLFNEMTHGSQTVGNYPGVTVEQKTGKTRVNDTDLCLVDLPGIYSLTAYSQDEIVARDFISEQAPDAVINVVNATCLERNLYLTIQLLEMQVPVVLALNMADIAEKRGVKVDVDKLAEELGISVVATIGNRGEGIDEVLGTVVETAESPSTPSSEYLSFQEEIESGIKHIQQPLDEADLSKPLSTRWLAIKLSEEDPEVAEYVKEITAKPDPVFKAQRQTKADIEERFDEIPATLIAEQRYNNIGRIAEKCLQTEGNREKPTWTDRLDSVVCHRVFGPVCVALCMYAIFKGVFFFAEDFRWVPFWNEGFTLRTPTGVFALIFDEWLPSLFQGMPEGTLRSLILDAILGGVGGVLQFVPIIFVMFFFLALLEDSGYIARIAFVMDRLLNAFGLQGKSIMALIISGGIAGGCAVPGVMATRIMREEKDRLTTMLVAPFMNCGAKLPLYSLLIAAFFASYKGEMLWLLGLISWIAALGAALVLRKTVTSGQQTAFLMEMHPYHVPHLKSVLVSTARRTWMYVQKAGTIILGVTIVLWAVMYFPRTEAETWETKGREAAEKLREKTEAYPQFSSLFRNGALKTTNAVIFENKSGVQDLNSVASAEKEISEMSGKEKRLLLREALQHDADSTSADGVSTVAPPSSVLEAFRAYKKEIRQIKSKRRAKRLRNSLAGKAGRALEPVTQLAGFDWRTNIALIGGFAAKEVIVSTLGTAYSLKGPSPEEQEGDDTSRSYLARQLQASWTNTQAFAMMLFVMIYAPCVATIAVMWKEAGSWKWPLFSTCYSTILAFIVAVVVYQVGKFLM